MNRKKRHNPRKHFFKSLIIKIGLLSLVPCLLFVLFYFFYINKSDNKVTAKSDNKIETKTSSNDKTPVKSKEETKNIVSTKKEPKTSEVLLSAAGDCTLGTDTKFNKATSLPAMFTNQNRNYSYFFKNVYNIFKSDDITTVNLETTFTDATTRAVKKFVFKGPKDYVNILKAGSVEAVNISNNHIYDYLQKGFNDTVATLQNANEGFFGEGHKWIKEVKGVKFGFLGYQGFSDTTKLRNTIKKDIEELKSKNCIVVINFHWGIERTYSPIKTQVNLAHYSIDNGADLIIGHHPHVIQGLEKYKDKLICYSMGNFCFGGNSNPSDKRTFIFQCNFKVTDNKVKSYKFRVIPCSISSVSYKNDYCPTPLNGASKTTLLNKINALSKNLGVKISDNFTEIKVQ